MSWTYPQLAAAVAALPAGTSPATAAALLGAQMTTLTGQPFTAGAARIIVSESTNASWGRIVQRSRQAATLPPVTAVDAAILCATTFVALPDSQVIDPSIPSAWAAWQAGLAALQAVGDLTTADVAALALLTTVTVPTWQPAPTDQDVSAALALTAGGS